jgi:L-lactate dehydrogenase
MINLKGVVIMGKNFNRKVSIIGAGNVGSTIAFSLVNSGFVSEIALLDRNELKAEGQVMDMMHGLPFVKPVKIYTGGFGVIEGSDIIVITAGATMENGETRIDLVYKNTFIFKELLTSITPYIGDAIILVVTNPVDIMSYLTYKLTGLPKERVIGSGTVLDTARFQTMVGEHLGITPRDVRGYILGEHGDSEFAAWSSTNVAGIPMENFCNQTGVCTPDTTKDNIEKEVRYAGYEVLNRKGSTYYAIGLAVNKIIESILLDENAVLTVSSLLSGQYGLEDVFLSVPCIVNKNGVDKILTMPLSERENEKLMNSANLLKDVISSVKL